MNTPGSAADQWLREMAGKTAHAVADCDYHDCFGAILAALRAAADAARADQRRRDAEVCRALSREAWAWHVEDGEPEDSVAALKSNTYENAALALERGAGRPEGA